MRRAELLIVSETTPQTLQGLRARGVVPFLDGDNDGWADYSLDQALKLALVLELAPHVGGQAEAAKRVEAFPRQELVSFLCSVETFRDDARADFWAATWIVPAPAGTTWESEPHCWTVCLVNRQFGGRRSLDFPLPLIGQEVRALTWLNLSAVARAMRARANAAGIILRELVDV